MTLVMEASHHHASYQKWVVGQTDPLPEDIDGVDDLHKRQSGCIARQIEACGADNQQAAGPWKPDIDTFTS